jgi:hypothetical protein
MRRTALALAGLLCFAACEQPGGTGPRVEITLGSAADLAKIGVDAAYPLDGDYTLGANLTLANWTPIGTGDRPFAGIFDGNGKTLNITGSGGLFAFADGALVRNLTVSGTITNEDGAGTVYVGGIVGNGKNTKIISCVSHADITVTGHRDNSSAGGIAGYLTSNSALTACSATGTITLRLDAADGFMLYAGGVLGYQGTGLNAEGFSGCVVSRCSFTGSVVAEGPYPYAGGIAGYNYCGSVISECYAAGGTVTARGENLPYAGGISGYNSRITGNPSRIENCHSDMTVNAVAASPQALAGGITGANAADAAVSRCYARGAVAARVNGSSGADTGGSLGVPVSANAGGIAGAQYFDGPSIRNCAALNREIKGVDTGSGGAFNIHRIAGSGTGDDNGVWETNIARVQTLTGGGPTSDSAGYDGADCAAKPQQEAYEALGWDFAKVWKLGDDGYPLLRWQDE